LATRFGSLPVGGLGSPNPRADRDADVAAAALAGIGLYGTLAEMVSQERRAIGIRLALGASRAEVMRLVVVHGLRLTALGLAAGLAASYALTRFIASLLFGVSATDLVTFVGVPLLLAGAAFAASYMPARRATRIDPMVALRYE
jgi:ABC-type antimicrobial peptide transport system permease subunit